MSEMGQWHTKIYISLGYMKYFKVFLANEIFQKLPSYMKYFIWNISVQHHYVHQTQQVQKTSAQAKPD